MGATHKEYVYLLMNVMVDTEDTVHFEGENG